MLETLDDGSINIVVEGGERFRLLELTAGGRSTPETSRTVTDEDDPAASEDADRAVELFNELAGLAGSDVDVPDRDSPQLDFELAARVDFGVDAKQELLASRRRARGWSA